MSESYCIEKKDPNGLWDRLTNFDSINDAISYMESLSARYPDDDFRVVKKIFKIIHQSGGQEKSCFAIQYWDFQKLKWMLIPKYFSSDLDHFCDLEYLKRELERLRDTDDETLYKLVELKIIAKNVSEDIEEKSND